MPRTLNTDIPLFQKVLRASYWSFGLRASERALQLVRTVLLARLLSPKDFGLFGIALLVLATLESFSTTGFQQALIQKRDDIKPYLDTAWAFSVLRGAALGLLVFCLGPLVGRFFHEPQAVLLFRIAGLCVFLKGLTNIGIVYFQKGLTFGKQFVYSFSGTLADLAVSIPAALIFRNAWALLLGFLAGNFVRVIASFVLEPYKPRFRLDLEKAREMSVFGRWIFAGSILTFLLNHGDDLVVGRLLGSAGLGLYRMAYFVSNLPISEVVHSTSDVLFSAFSKLQDRLANLRQAYLDTIHAVALITFPMTAGLLFVARDLTVVVLGTRWLPMVPALQALALGGFTRSIAATTGALFQSVGRPKISTVFQFARLSVFAILVYPMTLKGGILGTGLAVTLSALLTEPFAIYLSLRCVQCYFLHFVKLLMPLVAATGMMWLSLTLAQEFLPIEALRLRLGCQIANGILTYFAALIVIDRCFGCEIRSLFQRRYRRLVGQSVPDSSTLAGALSSVNEI
jgi:lipopolysaccharide exporter